MRLFLPHGAAGLSWEASSNRSVYCADTRTITTNFSVFESSGMTVGLSATYPATTDTETGETSRVQSFV